MRSMGQNWSLERRWQRLVQLQRGDLHRRCGRVLEDVAVYGIREVRVRPGVIANPVEVEPLAHAASSEERQPTGPHSACQWVEAFSAESAPSHPLIARLIAARGLAMRLYLTALYETQVRQRPGSVHTNDRLLWPPSPDDIGWIGLLAVTATVSTAGRSEMDNRLRQVKSAIGRLRREGAVTLPSENQPRHKFEHFLLRNDGGNPLGTPDEPRYVIPRRHEGVDIPVEFYTNNWMHCLTDSEIALWLGLRLLAKEHPEAHRESGVFMADRTRRLCFGLTRDAYECHATLRRFGLNKGGGNEPRWRAGRSVRLREQGLLEPLHFVLDDQTLDDSATEVIGAALQSRYW